MWHITGATKLVVLGFVLLPGLAAVACSGDDAKGQQVNVSLVEWSIKPGVPSIPAGDVTFVAKNNGTTEHELIVLKTDLGPAALKMKSAAKADEEASGQVIGEIEGLAPGKSGKAEFNLAAGKYVLLCNIEAHYGRGMTIAFEVK